jgi:hypothetical protein
MHGGIEADGDRYLIHYFSDRELTRLELDSDARVRAHQLAWFSSWRCWCLPVCLVHNLVCCSTLHMCTRFSTQERAVAAAHRLILRERTLLFEVDEHTVPAPQADGSYFPTCCWPGGVCAHLGGPCDATCGDATHVPDRRTIIRLAEIDSIEIEPAGASDCGCRSGPDHLVVTIRPTKDEEEALSMLGRHGPMRSGKVVAVLAGPKDGELFAQAVRAQAQRVVEERLDENPPSPDSRDSDSARFVVAPVRARRPTFAAVQEEPELPFSDKRHSCSTPSQPRSDQDEAQSDQNKDQADQDWDRSDQNHDQFDADQDQLDQNKDQPDRDQDRSDQDHDQSDHDQDQEHTASEHERRTGAPDEASAAVP